MDTLVIPADAAFYLVEPMLTRFNLLLLPGPERAILEVLIEAGEEGCVLHRFFGSNASRSVNKLRQMGLHIVSILEPRGGNKPGAHARYILFAYVTKEEDEV